MSHFRLSNITRGLLTMESNSLPPQTIERVARNSIRHGLSEKYWDCTCWDYSTSSRKLKFILYYLIQLIPHLLP